MVCKPAILGDRIKSSTSPAKGNSLQMWVGMSKGLFILFNMPGDIDFPFRGGGGGGLPKNGHEFPFAGDIELLRRSLRKTHFTQISILSERLS